jgi:hypothetical protein
VWEMAGSSLAWVRRLIGTFYLLAQKLVFCNSDLDKPTTAAPFIRWETWRFSPNLSGMHLKGMYLIGVCLTGVHLTGVHVLGVHLMGICLTGVHLMEVHLMGIHFMDMHVVGVHVTGMGVCLIGVISRAHISWPCIS